MNAYHVVYKVMGSGARTAEIQFVIGAPTLSLAISEAESIVRNTIVSDKRVELTKAQVL